MDNRRQFLKKSLLLTGAAGFASVLPSSVQRAFAIDPEPGSSFMDAEHIVILMQENRSFDHSFGSLQGVRGFNDPRAITLPNSNPVWLQTNKQGETYAPFRLNMRDTKATWMGDLPHSRSSQVDAFNHGKFDEWLNAKRSNNKAYADKPLTLGYYNREDLPFNYALADAFTICDQNFSSAMTSTWPNRLFFWTGTIREKADENVKANIRNTDLTFGKANWGTFPEKLEENGVSWNVYQNDLSCGGGYEGEERAWLGNFGCNPLELFAAYNVKFSERYIRSLEKLTSGLPPEIKKLKEQLGKISIGSKTHTKLTTDIRKKQEVLANAYSELGKWAKSNFDKLPEERKNLFRKAFSKNTGDPDYDKLATMVYKDGAKERKMYVPKGDVLHRFRTDVNEGKLPTVSWVIGPQNFSDHPSAPWYGAWYVSEVMDILTANPEVWKKTIFIMTYDENDGYYDHVPPFTPPDLKKPGTGKVSAGIDTAVEHIRREQEISEGIHEKEARYGAIGLGYRVPMIIASPWSRGGKVCSQVFDHTSTLQFLEHFVNKKFGKNIRETNISEWRRAVCGNLTSVFDVYRGEAPTKLPFLEQAPFIETIHSARYKNDPGISERFSDKEIAQIKKDPAADNRLPKQEPGTRQACAVPYELYADGNLSRDKRAFVIDFVASNEVFGTRSQGAPFKVYAPGRTKSGHATTEICRNWNYALKAGDKLQDEWAVDMFENSAYHLRAYGPNGFFREFSGNENDPDIHVSLAYERLAGLKNKLSGNITLTIINNTGGNIDLEISDKGLKGGKALLNLPAGNTPHIKLINLAKSSGWYDLSIRKPGNQVFEKRYAGRVETGKNSITDPVMGGLA